MRKILAIALCLGAGTVSAAPATQVAWTAETLALVASGDPERGEQLATACSSCHGTDGISLNPAFPSLAGQLPTYLYRQLRDYKDGSRENPLMQNFASGLSDQDMADLAAWYSRQKPSVGPQADSERFEAVTALVRRGDSKRIIPPCRVCHGENGQGERIDTPRIAGLSQTYLEQTLQAYGDGSRHNDIYGRMRLIAKQLTADEIRLLSEYYATLQP
ncbi:MAG: c-type cytochrome [Methylohalobius sp. ZOD2]|nr:cytochrome c4 [Methylothermaceae bacterium]